MTPYGIVAESSQDSSRPHKGDVLRGIARRACEADAFGNERAGLRHPRKEIAMRLRVLLSGLTFFAAALGLAWGPLMAEAHTVNDRVRPCTIVGTPGDDVLMGTSGNDVICGKGGNDTISGIGGDDIVRGGPGNDVLEGGAGRDIIRGGTGNDRLYAYDGAHDHIYGGRGYDSGRRDRTLDTIRGVESYPG
jgi:hypothetical protein